VLKVFVILSNQKKVFKEGEGKKREERRRGGEEERRKIGRAHV